MPYRIAVDTGGTFTDVVVAAPGGALTVGKAPSTPARSADGVKAGLADAARAMGISVEDLIGDADVLIYGTTWATNAIVTGTTAKTALLVTEGFPDILVYRQGGKLHPFELHIDPLKPYVPRRLTAEIPERVNSEGEVERALDEDAARAALARLTRQGVEAVAVCLLWSIKNPAHEERLGALIEEAMPGMPYTLSHRLNPILREYPRASSAAIDASLKPLMQRHLRALSDDLGAAGFAGELLVSTVSGGLMHVEDVADRPIFMVKSGPAMAPLAGIAYAEAEGLGRDVLVVDAGGTTFDVSMVRDGAVKYTRETWLGGLFSGHNLGLSSVDVRSVGAGGGSIAWIDPGGLLRVGPGPACYGRGGDAATVTDAAVVLGYIDPDAFLGGRMTLDVDAARRAVAALAEPLGKAVEETAAAILTLASETMIKAIEEITVNEGVNPRESVLVAGGGAAGLNILPIAAALGCDRVLLPKTAGALSACGAQYSDIVAEFSASHYGRTDHWDEASVNDTLADIDAEMEAFADRLRARGIARFRKDRFVDARYLNQQWETEIAMPAARFDSAGAVDTLIAHFHEVHERLYGVKEENGLLECLNWKGRLTAFLDRPQPATAAEGAVRSGPPAPRRTTRAFFGEAGFLETPVYEGAALVAGDEIAGPAIIEEPTTTVVVYPETRAGLARRQLHPGAGGRVGAGGDGGRGRARPGAGRDHGQSDRCDPARDDGRGDAHRALGRDRPVARLLLRHRHRLERAAGRRRGHPGPHLRRPSADQDHVPGAPGISRGRRLPPQRPVRRQQPCGRLVDHRARLLRGRASLQRHREGPPGRLRRQHPDHLHAARPRRVRGGRVDLPLRARAAGFPRQRGHRAHVPPPNQGA